MLSFFPQSDGEVKEGADWRRRSEKKREDRTEEVCDLVQWQGDPYWKGGGGSALISARCGSGSQPLFTGLRAFQKEQERKHEKNMKRYSSVQHVAWFLILFRTWDMTVRKTHVSGMCVCVWLPDFCWRSLDLRFKRSCNFSGHGGEPSSFTAHSMGLGYGCQIAGFPFCSNQSTD